MRSAALISAALLALLAPAHAAVAVPRGLQPLGAACSAKTPCASGCCSSHMNKDANKTVCVDAKVCSARGQPEWTYWWVPRA